MNEIFDWNRFKKVLAMDARGLWPRFGHAMLVMSCLPMAVWLFCLVLGKYGPDAMASELRWLMILGCAVLTAVVAPSRMYKNVNLKKNGVYYAMLPASHMEKYLSQVLFCLVVCPLCVVVGGAVVDTVLRCLPFGCYEHWLFSPSPWLKENWDSILDMIYDPWMFGAGKLTPVTVVLIGVLWYVSTGATFIFTNTIFKKHKVLMTILWMWIIGFVMQLIATPLMLWGMSNYEEQIELFVLNHLTLGTIRLGLWMNCILNLAWSALLLWWASRRIKKMTY